MVFWFPNLMSALPPKADMCGALGREPINLERSADVRFVAHNGLKSGAAPCPKSAKLGSRHNATSKFKLVERLALLV